MNKRLRIFILFIIIYFVSFSQILSQTRSFDVINYKLNFDIYDCFLSPYPTSFTASEVITLRTLTVLNKIGLDAQNESLEIIAVKNADDNPLTFSHDKNILTVNLNREHSPGETVDIKIEYRHKNVIDSAFYTSNGIVYTDSQPEGARHWYPCNDKPNDKATFDIMAKVPLSVMLGSNGLLADSLITGDSIYYHWVTKDPLSTYLAVLVGAVNNKLDIIDCRKLSNPNDSLPLRFYYNADEHPEDMENLICDLTKFYSEKFGEQPYEKNGFASVSKDYNSEGMENQTLTVICGGCWRQSLIAHEYAHQWFGDLITCGSWADLWINEGFATYCEALYDEHRFGYAKYKSGILEDANGYFIFNPGWAMFNSAWRTQTPGSDTLFDNAITYNKGACVLHMMRHVLGDTLFFNVLNAYANDEQYKFGNVYTEDFIESMSRYAGQDLSWFFNEWILQPNHPVYQNSYKFTKTAAGKWKVHFNIQQVQKNSGFYRMPMELKISFENNTDTTIRVTNNINNQNFDFTFNKKPKSVLFDPDNDIVLKTATLTRIDK